MVGYIAERAKEQRDIQNIFKVKQNLIKGCKMTANVSAEFPSDKPWKFNGRLKLSLCHLSAAAPFILQVCP